MKRIILTKENRLASIRDVNPKNQTRRVIVPQPEYIHRNARTNPNLLNSHDNIAVVEYSPIHFGSWPEDAYVAHRNNQAYILEPPYQVGDIVGMPEPYQVSNPGTQITRHDWLIGEYLDDGLIFDIPLNTNEMSKFLKRKKPYMKTSARFMYDSLIRHFFKVKRVRVERVQDISEEDAQAEGCDCDYSVGVSYKEMFCELWDSINKKRGYGWDKNNWVFVYDYERAEKNQ